MLDDNQSNGDQNTRRTPSPGTYRDSNASRLRQEISKFSGSTPVKRRRLRSRSLSGSSTKSNSSTPKSLISANASPERPAESTTVHIDSVPSSLDKEEGSKATIKKHDVIDTRSKTLHSAPPVPPTDKVSERKLNSITTNPSNATAKEARSGYGKPLVTPMNKHLVIRKPNGPISNPCTEKLLPAIPVNRCKSPMKSWKAENRSSPTTIATNKRDVSKTKLPTRDTAPANKARWSNAAPAKEADRRPKSSAPSNMTKSPIVSAQQRQSSPRRASSADRKPQDSKSLAERTVEWRYERNVKSWNSGTRTPMSGSSRSRTPTALRQHLKEEATKKYPSNTPAMLSEKQKKHTVIGGKTKFGNASSKSFKPQLEDIKSSYLLLNKKKLNRNLDTPVKDESKPKAPQAMDDNLRRVQLVEIKQKFKSKQFWNDSKYEKIEGLNWITWK